MSNLTYAQSLRPPFQFSFPCHKPQLHPHIHLYQQHIQPEHLVTLVKSLDSLLCLSCTAGAEPDLAGDGVTFEILFCATIIEGRVITKSVKC